MIWFSIYLCPEYGGKAVVLGPWVLAPAADEGVELVPLLLEVMEGRVRRKIKPEKYHLNILWLSIKSYV